MCYASVKAQRAPVKARWCFATMQVINSLPNLQSSIRYSNNIKEEVSMPNNMMKSKRLEQDAVSTTISAEDMSISSEGADDCASNMPSSAMNQSANAVTKRRTRNKQQLNDQDSKGNTFPTQAPSFGFRRCCLEHAKRHT